MKEENLEGKKEGHQTGGGNDNGNAKVGPACLCII